jgi:hypothetical protein
MKKKTKDVKSTGIGTVKIIGLLSLSLIIIGIVAYFLFNYKNDNSEATQQAGPNLQSGNNGVGLSGPSSTYDNRKFGTNITDNTIFKTAEQKLFLCPSETNLHETCSACVDGSWCVKWSSSLNGFCNYPVGFHEANVTESTTCSGSNGILFQNTYQTGMSKQPISGCYKSISCYNNDLEDWDDLTHCYDDDGKNIPCEEDEKSKYEKNGKCFDPLQSIEVYDQLVSVSKSAEVTNFITEKKLYPKLELCTECFVGSKSEINLYNDLIEWAASTLDGPENIVRYSSIDSQIFKGVFSNYVQTSLKPVLTDGKLDLTPTANNVVNVTSQITKEDYKKLLILIQETTSANVLIIESKMGLTNSKLDEGIRIVLSRNGTSIKEPNKWKSITENYSWGTSPYFGAYPSCRANAFFKDIKMPVLGTEMDSSSPLFGDVNGYKAASEYAILVRPSISGDAWNVPDCIATPTNIDTDVCSSDAGKDIELTINGFTKIFKYFPHFGGVVNSMSDPPNSFLVSQQTAEGADQASGKRFYINEDNDGKITIIVFDFALQSFKIISILRGGDNFMTFLEEVTNNKYSFNKVVETGNSSSVEKNPFVLVIDGQSTIPGGKGKHIYGRDQPLSSTSLKYID